VVDELDHYGLEVSGDKGVRAAGSVVVDLGVDDDGEGEEACGEDAEGCEEDGAEGGRHVWFV
jgi:hypothetical protein